MSEAENTVIPALRSIKRVSFWNEVNEELLRNAWTNGKTASEIAVELHCTRNMVIGKKHRLGLERRIRTGDKVARPRQRSRAMASSPRLAALLKPIEKPIPVPGGVHIMDLQHHHCRAIVGHGEDGLARYCGATKEGFIDVPGGTVNSPYCVTHGYEYYQRDTSGQ